VQVARTRTVAQAAKDEADRIHRALAKYDAAQEIARASVALETARRFVENDAWREGAQSYEQTRNSLLSIKSNVPDLTTEARSLIDQIAKYSDRLCERVDKGEFDNPSPNALAKTKAVMRSHTAHIQSIALAIRRESI